MRSSRWRPDMRLPAVYPFRDFGHLGGLISYGPDLANSSAARRLRWTAS